ncbi:hypothetical protein M1601_01030 [Mycoplasma capricolum subsp. capripneumoniae M1601]|nr:hypothetical protein M1601_01030 [Mycoplasma capricolum subsp. capripneumoniae M1601]
MTLKSVNFLKLRSKSFSNSLLIVFATKTYLSPNLGAIASKVNVWLLIGLSLLILVCGYFSFSTTISKFLIL